MKITTTKYKTLAVFLLSVGIMTSCNAIYEDLPECAPPPNLVTTVDFVYDYNMLHTDLLKEHVGSVYLYIFDNEGIYRLRREAHKSDMPGAVDFSMRFDTTEIKPGNRYQFVAIAQANHAGYTASLETPGFTLQTEMIPGVSTINDYVLKLDRDGDNEADFGIVDFRDAYGHTETMMDTLWTTKPDAVQIIDIPKLDYKPSPYHHPDQTVEIEVPMMRITNSVTVNLHSPGFRETTSADNYSLLVHFPHGNGTIDFTGNTLPAQELYYRALRKKMVETSTTKADGQEYALQAVFGLSRLQVSDESSLQIRDAVTNEIIAEIPDFSYFLAKNFDHGMDNQEFLDREYDFDIDITLDNDGSIRWIDLSINILGWHVRVMFKDL